jgi:hypothetical protein
VIDRYLSLAEHVSLVVISSKSSIGREECDGVVL